MVQTIINLNTIRTMPSPAELVELPFMRTAVIELALLAVAGGLLGAWIVLRRLAFFAHAVGGATFPGLVVADAAGARPLVGALAVALGYAGAVHQLGSRATGRGADAVTGVALAGALAAGAVLASDVFHSGARVDTLLFGSLLGLSGGDLWAAAAAALAAVAGTLAVGGLWVAVGFDRRAAGALSGRVRLADALLLGLVAVTVVSALPGVGALLTASLFVVPAATARMVAPSVTALLAGSVAVAIVEGLGGSSLALWLDAPPGATVAVVGGAAFAAVAIARTALSPAAAAA
jgi:manganese/iron transport system permease protein